MKMQTTEAVKCIKVFNGTSKKNGNSFKMATFAWMGGSKEFFVEQNMDVQEGKMYTLSVAIEKDKLVLKGFIEATELKK